MSQAVADARGAAAREARALRLALIVPCHNEVQVIERKLANLRRAFWPTHGAPSLLLVVDDHSSDGTAERARQALAIPIPGLQAEVLESDERRGKTGAIACGLRAIGSRAEVLALSDADVVFEPDALELLRARLEAEPRLGLVCAAQSFVHDLAADGTCRSAAGGALVAAGGLYDRLTAWVRALESSRGALFSVHGQLVAWRAALEWQPRPGMAADDLDLMLAARLGGWGAALVPSARFHEVKTPAGADRDAQAARRARAYVQFLEHPRWREFEQRASLPQRLHAWCYRALPTHAAWIVVGALVLGALIAWQWGGVRALLALALGVAAFAASSVGRRLAALLGVISSAVRAQSRGTLSDRWETPRRSP